MRKLARIIKGICSSTLGLVGVAVIIACLLGWCHQRQEKQEEIYTVQYGDTLSEIAEAYAQKDTGTNRDAGELMQDIVEHNPVLHHDKTIHPGQELKITYWVRKD